MAILRKWGHGCKFCKQWGILHYFTYYLTPMTALGPSSYGSPNLLLDLELWGKFESNLLMWTSFMRRPFLLSSIKGAKGHRRTLAIYQQMPSSVNLTNVNTIQTFALCCKAFKSVTRQTLKDEIHCQDVYWSHANSGRNRKYFFPFLFLYVCFLCDNYVQY